MINKKKNKLRVAIYIRVSTDEKSSKWASISAQKKAILDFVKRNDDKYIINQSKNIYIDNWYSWATDERPSFKKLMEDADNKKFDIVIVWKIDRFFRKILLLLWYVENLYNLWIEFKSITQDFDTSGSFWKTILSVLWIMAELERELIIERTMIWRKTKAENWFYVWWWKTPLWYNKIEKWKWNILEIDKQESEIVKRVFDLFVNDKKSINEIARIFTNEKVETKNIKKQIDDKKGVVKKWVWHTKTLSELLKNTKYIWKYYYWRTWYKIDKDTKKRIEFEKDKEEWMELTCPRIVDDEIFNKAQVLIEKNKVIKNNKRPYAFTWLITCMHCWKSYIWYKTSKKTLSYKCNWTKRDKMRWKDLCKNEQVSELILFEYVWGKLDHIFRNPKEVIEAYYNKDLEDNSRIKKLKEERGKLEINIDEKDKKLLQMQEDYYFLEWLRKSNQEKIMKKTEKDINDMNERLNEVKERIEQYYNVQDNRKNLIKMLKAYKEIYKSLTDEDKLDLIKEFVEKVEIDWKDINVVFKFSIKNNNKWWWKGKKWEDKEKSKTKPKSNILSSVKNAVTWNTIWN